LLTGKNAFFIPWSDSIVTLLKSRQLKNGHRKQSRRSRMPTSTAAEVSRTRLTSLVSGGIEITGSNR